MKVVSIMSTLQQSSTSAVVSTSRSRKTVCGNQPVTPFRDIYNAYNIARSKKWTSSRSSTQSLMKITRSRPDESKPRSAPSGHSSGYIACQIGPTSVLEDPSDPNTRTASFGGKTDIVDMFSPGFGKVAFNAASAENLRSSGQNLHSSRCRGRSCMEEHSHWSLD